MQIVIKDEYMIPNAFGEDTIKHSHRITWTFAYDWIRPPTKVRIWPKHRIASPAANADCKYLQSFLNWGDRQMIKITVMLVRTPKMLTGVVIVRIKSRSKDEEMVWLISEVILLFSVGENGFARTCRQF